MPAGKLGSAPCDRRSRTVANVSQLREGASLTACHNGVPQKLHPSVVSVALTRAPCDSKNCMTSVYFLCAACARRDVYQLPVGL